ncbi:MAG: hypothetical protein FWE87_01400, partial [Coriobacteriia bacterium]|nr:hypothetical protein [Coriobacteriia bacterium]
FQPVRISTEDPDTPYAVFQLMPSIVDGEPVAGKMQDAYGFMWIADEEMRALGDPELIRVGQTYSIAEGKAIRFDGLSSALLLRVVDDWSVPYLYSLAVLTTLALSIALLFCPRFCAIYIDEKTGELKALTRYYRPHAQNAEEIEAKIQHVFAAQK